MAVKKATASTETSRADALESFLGTMAKEHPGAVNRLNDSIKSNIKTISTGAISLDAAIGAGGFPLGKITELFGPEGGGKTTVALSVAANAQREDPSASIGFIDAEHGLNRELAQNIGIDESRFVVYQPTSGEDAVEMTEKMVNSGAFTVVIVDSVAAMTPLAEINADMEQQFMGLHARLMSRFMRRVAAPVNEMNVALILINQIRTNLQMYGAPAETTGGKAIKFYSSLRVEVRTSASKKLTRDSEVVGHTVTATVKKNRLGPPHRTAEFDIIYGKGIDQSGSLLDLAEELGVISRSGAYYTEVSTGEKLSVISPDGQVRALAGKENVKELIRNNPDISKRLTAAVKAATDSDMLPGVIEDPDSESEDALSEED